MDRSDAKMRYNTQEPDGETSIQFLPASEPKPVKKDKRKTWVVVGVVIAAAIIAVVVGLLVWCFLKSMTVKKMYGGSMRITSETFQDAYEDPNSTEYQALAGRVVSQLASIYQNSPDTSKYYVGTSVEGFSEGSVLAYHLSEFNVPKGQEDTVDHAIGTASKIQSRMAGNTESLSFEDLTSSAVDSRMFQKKLTSKKKFILHAKGDTPQELTSPGFPNSTYPSNTIILWQLRADRGNIIKLNFDTFMLDDDCRKDFVRVYDSLVEDESCLLAEKCGHYAPTEPVTFFSSGNVMLLTLVTNDKHSYPGFRAYFSQVPISTRVCGTTLSGSNGNFNSPEYPNYYPPSVECLWNIQVPAGKYVKVRFLKFLLSELGHIGSDCQKDYVAIDGQKYCGEKKDVFVVINKSNMMKVLFHADKSLVDRGFLAEFEAFEPTNPCPDTFRCKNYRCIKPQLQCNGWNDCGDNSDEMNCKCNQTQISCKNGLCKSPIWKCDGVDDCGDGTDEMGCGTCQSGEVSCQNGKCISEKMKCDGQDNCGDGSDEQNCASVSVIPCTNFTYQCADQKCINKVNPECDGTPDCEDGSDEASCDCGRQLFRMSRIVGGQNSLEGEWPWQVSLHVNSGHVCGASLISDTWLVTAAHCVQDEDNLRLSQPGTWEVYLGLHDQNVKDIQRVVRKLLKNVIQHPNYNPYTYDFDIALMQLDSPVTFSQYIMPVCLPNPAHDFPVGKSVWVTGWGTTQEAGRLAQVLQKAEVRIINSTVCNQLMANQITSRMLCAGVLSGGVDACQGDSGGPLTSLDIGRRYFLAGVVSWGDGCARRNRPGIYTRVTQFRGWIKEKTGV
ncbi:ST14 transmembrane serine protease matriptase a [Brienomyrus brachyistius]|uniref:ST14 transmembrane serine protease matriptase a n=1 Tax=Brienomyrus brachyistius TaxID=42636 RepID=UPI0020B460C5|nr:ST14 transmembrane serine protease matriptase a [Brienomyrus brachyistius]